MVKFLFLDLFSFQVLTTTCIRILIYFYSQSLMTSSNEILYAPIESDEHTH